MTLSPKTATATTNFIINIDDVDVDVDASRDVHAASYFGASDLMGDSANGPAGDRISCIFGCEVNKLALCSFPVMDQKRCKNWLKFFELSEERVRALGGLSNLRVCLQHFNRKKEMMASTRLKMLPMRPQQGTSTTGPGSGAVVGSMTPARVAAAAEVKARFAKANGLSTSVLTPRPTPTSMRRADSMSSATSTGSGVSSSQSPPNEFACQKSNSIPLHRRVIKMAVGPPGIGPAGAAAAVASPAAPQLTKPSNVAPLIGPPKNVIRHLSNPQGRKRKVYEITQESNDASGRLSEKRKMYLMVDDNPNSLAKGERKKVIIFRQQQPNDTVPQDFNENLTHILNSIFVPNGLDKQQGSLKQEPSDSGQQQHYQPLVTRQPLKPRVMDSRPLPTALKEQPTVAAPGNQRATLPVVNSVRTLVEAPAPAQAPPNRQPVTLPPKKNRSLIEQAEYQQQQADGRSNLANRTQIMPSAPVVANKPHTAKAQLHLANGPIKIERPDNVDSADAASDGDTDEQSADVLFFLSLLPLLQSIPNPQKQSVKSNLERYIKREANKHATTKAA